MPSLAGLAVRPPLGLKSVHEHDARDVKFRAAVRAAAIELGQPSARTWSRPRVALSANGASFGPVFRYGTFMNLRYGTCTGATYGHIDQTVCYHTGATPTVTDSMILDYYESTGWSRERPLEHDDGATLHHALKWFSRARLIDAYAEIETSDHSEIEAAINLTVGGCVISLALPESCLRQAIWDTARTGERDGSFEYGSYGNHSVQLVDYDQRYVTCITWGRPQIMTWEFLASYNARKGYAVFHRALSKTPEGALTPAGLTARAIRLRIAQLAD